ncbi:MAG: hypothetical protein AAGD25_07975 [Cyanobacteria bacterium P01_F01_bin.150]
MPDEDGPDAAAPDDIDDGVTPDEGTAPDDEAAPDDITPNNESGSMTEPYGSIVHKSVRNGRLASI